MTPRVARRASHLDRRLPHRVLVCAGPAARGDTGIEKPCAGRPAGRRGRRDRVGACRDVRGRGTDHQSGGRREHGIRRCVAVLRLPAHAIQHHRRARQRAAAGGPDGGWIRGGTTRVRAGCRDAGAAHLVGTAIAGRAALFAGRLDSACALLGKAAPALSASGNAMGWGYRYHIPYATALAMRGATDEAAAVLAALDDIRRPFRMLDYERSLARAWLAAGQGALTEAITTMLSAAETAAAKGQFAAEVVCLQTAVQFGDHSGASRLSELESMVEGPRAKLVARFATALSNSDGPELSAISEEFEQLGDLVAAVDAAAHACTRVPPRAICGDQLLAVRRARRRWRNDAAASARLRCARSANRCR